MQCHSMAVCCPNCGQENHRTYSLQSTIDVNLCPQRQMMKTECPHCDYLMVMCVLNGRVLETYAPGLPIASQSVTTSQARSSLGQQLRAEAVVLAASKG